MASSSRLVSDNELHKNKDDSKEHANNPSPILSSPSNNGEGNKEEDHKDKTGNKKKLVVLSQEYVDTLLSYQCRFYEHKTIDRLAEEDGEKYGYYKTLVTEADEITKRDHDTIREYQARIRRDLETKGYVSYEVTDDGEEDGSEGVNIISTGIMKHAGGGIKKLN
ncbi:hypothetical protein PR202_gb13572 [Eleusine coracana subsp. coracana]|uniref:Uncharacterized protein n=1 Tax=Eleusine coracana subsp. coracana TaxID=191504 RepID=A0AAV5EQK8_ELECO|nr:hypothetical protein PR202_gb13572 [Eleusine coracana subsp. coracana]